MSRRRLFALLLVATLALPVGLAWGAPADEGNAASSATKGPRIKSGRYGSGDVYLDVNVKARKVHFYFTLYCQNPFANQYVSSGPGQSAACSRAIDAAPRSMSTANTPACRFRAKESIRTPSGR